jgi:uncharacterized protein YdeI (YjbR/CyaY-like superfamily)
MPGKIAAPAPETHDPRIDAYIEKAKPFAQPILAHLRELIHKAVPDVTETIKWSHAFFEYKGRVLANMAAFKEHCSLGFWGREMTAVLRERNLLRDGAMGSLGRITSIKELPSNKEMLLLFRQAASQIDEGAYTSPMAGQKKNTMARAAKPALETPHEFAKALKANKAAAKVFAEFSPSCKREYIEWITEAKREETRSRRLAQAVEMIAEGKQRNWKYQ